MKVYLNKLFLLKQPPEVFCEKVVLRNFAKFTGKHLCQSLFFNNVAETLAQVFSCEFCEISKNTFFKEHIRKTASVPLKTTNEFGESDSQERDSRIFLNYSEYFIFDYVIR